MSKKYNEIMDKVVVTDEMRRRVLREISSADPERLAAYKMDADEDLSKAFSGRKRYPASKILAGLAVACVLILIAGIIRISQPLMSPSMTGSVEYEEAKEYAAEEAEEDTMVGNQDMVDQPELTGGEAADEGIADAAAGVGNAGAKTEAANNGTDGAAADGTVDEEAAGDAVSDRADMTVRLSEPEIRKIVETYIGPEFEISDTDIEESVLIYTVSKAQSAEIFSYIRIDVSDGSVEVENVQTGEISTLTFREMAGQ
ncbi:MAG: hypothetical protein IKG01_09255 [Lachnospiraceae bacterium]|nr:hypothetical protein [Lachnospiraceae bacterium]